MGLSRLLAAAFTLTLAASPLACSSSSSSGAATTTEPREQVHGEYKATTPGLISKVSFVDGTHYEMLRTPCADSENTCVERGTYAFSSAMDSVTFTNEKTGNAMQLPFKVTSSSGSSGLTSEQLHALGGSLYGGEAGVSVSISLGEAGTIDLGKLISLILSFLLGNQNFTGGSDAGTIDSGMPSTGGGGGGNDAGGIGQDAGSPGVDSSVDASDAADGGDGEAGYPAFAPYMPQVIDNGAAVMSNPTIVTITWGSDSNATTYEAFGDAIGTSDYWSETTSEYGVGEASSGTANHVRMTTTLPASMKDTDLADLITTTATNAPGSGWPAPTANTIYVLYLPSTTNLTVDGAAACTSGLGGYHNSVEVQGQAVAYAVMPNCASFTVDDIVASSAHELIEASTDSFPGNGFTGFDDDHLSWDILQNFQDEIADACEFYTYAQTTDALGTNQMFGVQRSWSNQNAMMGHAPCVPTYTQDAYYNVTPLALEGINIKGLDADWHDTGAVIQTLGYDIQQGDTRTIQIGYYSDGPTSGPWTVSAIEGIPQEFGTQLVGGTNHLSISIDTTSGQNGTTANVTITVNSVNATYNGEVITFASQLGSGETHYMPILISNM